MLITQQAIIATLMERVNQVELLEERIKELEARLNQNSKNSHRPPSSDGMKRPKRKPAFPRKGNKPKGGQKPKLRGSSMKCIGETEPLKYHSESCQTLCRPKFKV